MIRELKTFLAVVQHGTFARAGAQIGLTPSAVSAQIHRLEDELGATLFDRTGRAALLNDVGRQTIAIAGELLAVYGRLGTQSDQAGSSGVLKVGAIASAQTALLVDAIDRFRRQLPGWQVRVVPGVSLQLLAQLDAGELDLAVMIKPPFAQPSELRWQTLAQEPFVLLVPRRLAGDDWRALLRSQPFIRYDRASFGGRLVDRFLRRSRIIVNDVVELDELQGIVGLVQRGVGVALLPLAASLLIPKTLATIDIGDGHFYREVGLARRDQRSERAAAACFAAALLPAVGPDTSDAPAAPARARRRAG